MPKHLKPEIPHPDNVLQIPLIVDMGYCDHHMAGEGQPCWTVHTLAGKKLPAVCNYRAYRAGYRGQIQPASLGIGRDFGQS
jgi:hypothetical protein